MEFVKSLLHSRAGDVVKGSGLNLLRFLTALFWKARVPAAPPYSIHPARAFRGDLTGCLIANPLGDTSPHFVLGYFEPHITRAIHQHVKRNDVAYDIGANIGYHSMVLARHVGSGGKVFSFEPNKVDYDILHWNVTANHLEQIEVTQAAVSNQVGSVLFASFNSPGVHHILREGTPADAKISQVSCITLDHYIYVEDHPAPSFIKVDVEGSELCVFEGGERLLCEARPVIVSEVWHKNREQVFNFMGKVNYRWQALYQDAHLSDILFSPAQSRS